MASFRVLSQTMTREEWLNAMISQLRSWFKNAKHPLPEVPIQASCGWPVGVRALASPSGKSRAIGQCFASSCTPDGSRHFFVSPCVTDSLEVGAVVVHELAHAVLDCKGEHGPEFKRVAVAVGLEGKMTATHAGPALVQRLSEIVDSIGPYPHNGLDAMTGERKKQGTRLIKLQCPDEECGYTVRTTAKWLEVGLPVCPCGSEMIEAPAKGEGE